MVDVMASLPARSNRDLKNMYFEKQEEWKMTTNCIGK